MSHEGYFRHRNVPADFYGKYRMPVYPLNTLPGDRGTRVHFWNLAANSAFHTPSPRIFTFE